MHFLKGFAMDRKIVILCGDKDFFGQTRKPWVSMNLAKIQDIFQQHGFTVEKHTFHEMVNREESMKNSLIFYSFSQKESLRNYINDLVSFLDDGSNTLIPSYELLKCHENKGYQELYKKKKDIRSLKTYYLSSRKELAHYQINFPMVFKTLDGSNAKGVYLAGSKKELIKWIKRNDPSTSLFTRLDLLRRKHSRRKKTYPEYPDYTNKKDYEEYKDYMTKQKSFILQEYIPNLTYDYRVLIFYDKYYVMKRHTKAGDFRASGTKRFDFDFELDPSLLDYAKQIFEKLDTPMVSLDIGFNGEDYSLFEFQALHFGVSAIVKSKGYYYSLDNNEWSFTQTKSDLETEVAHSVIKYIQERAEN